MDAIELIKYKGAKGVLETLVAYPDRLFTISELAKTAKVPFSSTWRLVQKWEPAGMVETGRLGNNVTVRFKKSAFTRQVVEIMRLNVSPQRHAVDQLKETLKNTPGVKSAWLFGSVAMHTERLNSDIDLAIWADDRFNADEWVFKIAEMSGTKVMPLVFKDKNEMTAFLQGKKSVRLR